MTIPPSTTRRPLPVSAPQSPWLACGVHAAAMRYDIAVEASDVADPRRMTRLRANGIDGVLIKTAQIGDAEFWRKSGMAEALAGLPHLWVQGRPPGFSGDSCGSDDDDSDADDDYDDGPELTNAVPGGGEIRVG